MACVLVEGHTRSALREVDRTAVSIALRDAPHWMLAELVEAMAASSR